ncbi:hypothetical protein [Halobacillus amylolyticus]|uniref:Uncharacterized protein n=1 Tax=Halobacillus amylolyticus TaxID=2932259 RepID=A0ABY4HIE5_9BACI|nr:hypothetical protein [Halobacillus amylolyticus]UOR14103.1 hypothetical protein MUO15_21345 [Halobacillus amylolyticus]
MKLNLDHFSVFYLNFDKVFEIAMLLDNKVPTQEDQNEQKTHTTKLTARLKAMLSTIFTAEGEGSYEFSKATGLNKTVEIKTTNAVILRSLISAIKVVDGDIDKANEGQLVLINDIELSLSNEEETRQMKLVKQGVLDRFTHEDISIGELMKTIGEDHSYLITAKKNSEQYLFKIPSEVQNEFENNYTIDDLFVGNVSLIGIYKGNREIRDLKSTFSYLTQNDTSVDDEEIEESSESESGVEKDHNNEMYRYLDLLAIVQRLEF